MPDITLTFDQDEVAAALRTKRGLFLRRIQIGEVIFTIKAFHQDYNPSAKQKRIVSRKARRIGKKANKRIAPPKQKRLE